MTIRVDAVIDIGEADPRVSRYPGSRAAPINYVVDAIARRAGINSDRVGVEALAHPIGGVEGTGTLIGPGRALIGALKDTQDVGVRTVCDGEVAAGALDRGVDHLHSGRIGNSSWRSEVNRDLADAGSAGHCAVSRQPGRNRRRRAIERLSPVQTTVG